MKRFAKFFCILLILTIALPAVHTFAQDLQAAIKLTKSEQFGAARNMFKKLIQQSPDDGDLYFYYGKNFMEKYYSDTITHSFDEQADSARIIYELGIQKAPNNPLNYVGLGEIAMIKKDMATAQTLYTKASSLLPSKANKSIVMSPEQQANVMIQMVEGYVTALVRDTAQVFALLRNAEKLDSKNPELYITKGDVYILLLNDGSKAISNYNKSQELDPKSPMAKLRIGQLWMRARNYTDALTFYKEVVKIDSTFAPAYRELGYLLTRANRNQEAQQNYKKFLALSAGNTSARKQYVNILMELRNYVEAIYQLNEIMKVDSSDNDLNRALAYCYCEFALYDKGLYYIQKFIKNAKPEKIRSLDYSYYGKLLGKSKQDSLASVMYMKAFELDTSKTDLLSEIATSYYKQKKYKKAAEVFTMKINMGKGSNQDFFTLGKAYYVDLQYKKADSILLIVLKMQPENATAILQMARTKSKLDSVDLKNGTNFTGYSIPYYESYLVKTQADSAKYMKERFEAYDYMGFYYYSRYSVNVKSREDAEKALKYWSLMSALNPSDEKADRIKPILDRLRIDIPKMSGKP